MLDKFQKLFGPNPPRGSAVRPDSPLDDMELRVEDEEHRRQVARVKNKRRLLGLLALCLLVAIIAPALFEPNDMYAERGAKLEIPSLQDDTAAKVVPLNRTEKSPKVLPTDIASQEPPSAKSLKSDNPVTASAKPITTPEQKSAAAQKKTAKTETPKQTAKAKDTQKNAQAASKSVAKTNDKGATSAKAEAELRAVTHGRYFIQVVATSKKESAEKVAADLRKLGLPSYTEIVRRRGSDLWRVRVGRFASEEDAKRALDILALNSISNGGVHTDSK